MSPQVQELLTKAMELSPGERAELSDLLVETLSPPGTEMSPDESSAYWSKELVRRSEAYERGEMEASDYRESVARVRQSLKQEAVDVQ